MLLLGFITGCLIAFTLTGCIGGGGSPGAPPTAGNLSALEVKSGGQSFALAPSFDPGRLDYTVTVGSNISSVTIVATVADSRATLKINNQSATSAQAFGPFSLNVGSNPPVLISVDGPGAFQTYTVTITRAVTTSLSQLAVSAGTLIQVGTNQSGYTPSVLAYTVQAPFTTTTTTVTPTVADAAASVTVNGAAVPSGQASQPIALAVGQTVITVVVTAPGVPSTAYTMTITRQQGSTNANLGALTISPGALSPGFNAVTLSYTASVTNPTSSLTVTATVQDPTSLLQINNQSWPSGQPFTFSNLVVGPNPITITVVPQTGTPKVYLVTVTRLAPGNVNLNALSVNAGTLTPAFVPPGIPGPSGYSVNVLNNVPSITVTAGAQDGSSSLTINGQATAALTVNPLPVGNTVFTIVVTANPAGNSQTYTVTVSKSATGNATLGSLSLKSTPSGQAVALAPVFSPTTLTYTANVASSSVGVEVTAIAAVPGAATVTINGLASPQTIVPTVTGTPVSIVVTSAAGNNQTYNLTITKNSADLASLAVTAGSVGYPLTPTFDSGTLAYAVTVAPLTPQVEVTAVGTLGATVLVNGTPPGLGGQVTVPLTGPATFIAVTVTPSTGPPNTTYNLTVNR